MIENNQIDDLTPWSILKKIEAYCLCIWHCFPRGQEMESRRFLGGPRSKSCEIQRPTYHEGKLAITVKRDILSEKIHDTHGIFVHLTNQMVDVYCVWFQGGVFLLDVWPPCLILVGQKVHSSSIPKLQSTIGIIHI